MHLSPRLPQVQPSHFELPTRCPLPHPKNSKRKWGGTHSKAHQPYCRKPVRASRHGQVIVRHYRCSKCQRTFWVYPTGVSAALQSDTLKGLSVLLYLLGLSCQGVSAVLTGLGWFIGTSTVYANAQAAGVHAIRFRRQWLKSKAAHVLTLRADFTHVKCHGQDRVVAVATGVLSGQPITFDPLKREQSGHIECRLGKFAKTLGAEVMVTNDADGLKNVAETLDLEQQVRRHM